MPFFEVRSTNAIRFVRGWSVRAKLAATYAVGAMSEKAKGYCAEAIGLSDHSLKELAELGHPYAKRHGPEGSGLHDPYLLVHVQEGALLAGLHVRAPRAIATGATSSVYNSEQPLDTWIQIGTEKMIARPYMHYVRTAKAEEILAAGRAEFERHFTGGAELSPAEVA